VVAGMAAPAPAIAQPANEVDGIAGKATLPHAASP